MEEAKRTFRPELLNRFDETVVFRKLGKEDVVTILDLELAKLRTRLSEKDMTLELDKKAVDFLVAKGSDDAMGARPLRRAVQQGCRRPRVQAAQALRAAIRQIAIIIASHDSQLRALCGLARDRGSAQA